MYQNELCLFIPYTMLAFFLYRAFWFVSRDKTITEYGVSMVYNLGYLSVFLSSIIHSYDMAQKAIVEKLVISALIGYYCMDTTNLYNDKTAKYRNAYIFHHLVSLQLLYLHYCGTLPLSVGVVYLTLFELSNIFLIPYQLCLNKQWTNIKVLLAHPMVWTYTPIRLVAIPVCSYYYLAYLQLNTWIGQYCMVLLGLINLYSMYYGLAIGYKYYLYLQVRKVKIAYTKT